MKIELQYIVSRGDPRAHLNIEKPDFNDGVLLRYTKEIQTAEELWALFYRYEKYVIDVQWFRDWNNRNTITYTEKSYNEQFEQDIIKLTKEIQQK